MNPGLTAATLMDCIAAMPCAAGSRDRPFMTKLENAKNTPAIDPQPMADTNVRTEKIGSLMSA
jgi:hypothetical protein